jgi:hypothetical protein
MIEVVGRALGEFQNGLLDEVEKMIWSQPTGYASRSRRRSISGAPA